MSQKKPQLDQSDLIDALPLACANEQAAIEFLEGQRWGESPCCPRCGSVAVYKMTDRATGERNKRFLWRCRDCKQQYSVRTGTVYEESLIPLHKWCRAMWESATAKNGVSALEMSRRLQITYRAALFLMHRIRHGMAPNSPQPKLTGTVEADETYVGGKPRYQQNTYKAGRAQGKPGWNPLYPKTPVFAVVQRGGNVRARVMATVNSRNVSDALLEAADRSANLMTDESSLYLRVGKPFASHGSTKHSSRQYVDKNDPTIHSNTIESFFARVKRQLNGTYHAVSKQHLHRYIVHAEFLYNSRMMNDGERTQALLAGMRGKRLMYKDRTKKAG
jgi:transposase-like protein